MFDVAARFHWYLSKAREFPGVHALLRELQEESWFSATVWRESQASRLRNMLTFARDCVPYYRELFRRIGLDPKSTHLLSDLSRVPLLTKGVIKRRSHDLLAENSDRSRLFRNATGGSTGVPLEFFQDGQYQVASLALDAYVRNWWGIQPYDKTASIWGADREFQDLTLKERFYEWRQRTRSLNAFRMSEDGLRAFCRQLTRWRPPYLMGYASALEAMAQCVKDNGIKSLRFRAIRSSAETLWPHQRQLIEEAFDSPVFNFYGSREVNNLAAECPEEHRLHLISTRRYVEVVDEDGQPVPDGTPGYVVVTDLMNHGMPFIRYRNEDMAAFAEEPCPCGRPMPVLEKLLGRSTDLIRTPSGEIIHGEFFTHLFYGCDSIAQFQVHQTSLDRLVVRFKPVRPGAEQAMCKIVDKIHERLGDAVAITQEACSEIPLPPSGKHRFTISDVNTESTPQQVVSSPSE
jgi:phenylacetate-CoA ligase